MKLVALALALLAFSTAAQEVAEEASPRPSAWSAAAWCEIDLDGEEPVEDAPPGCDAGAGLSLHSRPLNPSLSGRRWVSWVAVIGEHTIGTGLALTIVGGDDLRVSLAAGATVQYDREIGILADTLAPALGATISF